MKLVVEGLRVFGDCNCFCQFNTGQQFFLNPQIGHLFLIEEGLNERKGENQNCHCKYPVNNLRKYLSIAQNATTLNQHKDKGNSVDIYFPSNTVAADYLSFSFSPAPSQKID